MPSSPSHSILRPITGLPLRCLIVDDELSGREVLKTLIRKHCPELTLVAEASSVDEGCAKVGMADLVFLDIELPDGTGFDILDQAESKQFEVIFVTAYDQYGIQAIKASATDYLLKPVSVKELKAAVERVLIRIAQNLKTEAGEIRADGLKRLMLPNAEGFAVIEVENIIRCTAQSNYTQFHLLNGKTILVSKTLREYETLLAESGFVRIHNSHIVNLTHVRSYVRGKGGYVIMSDGSYVDVSTRRKEAFLNALAQ